MSFTKFEHDFRKYNRAGLTTPTDIIVYLTIKGYYNDDYGYAFPTVKTIAYDSGVSDKTVERSITRLKSLGLLTVKKTPQDNKVNNIYVPLEPIADDGKFNARFKGAEEDARKRLGTIEARRNKPTKREREAPTVELPIEALEPSEAPPDTNIPPEPITQKGTVIRTSPPAVLRLDASPKPKQTPAAPTYGAVPDGYFPEMIAEEGKKPVTVTLKGAEIPEDDDDCVPIDEDDGVDPIAALRAWL